MAQAELSFSKRKSKISNKRGNNRMRTDGIAIEPQFCPTDVKSPFDTAQWDLRTAAIKAKTAKSYSNKPTAKSHRGGANSWQRIHHRLGQRAI